MKTDILKFKNNETSEYMFYKRVIDIYTCLQGIRLTPTETTILIYFCIYGINNDTIDKIIEEGIVKTVQHYRNIKCKLEKVSLIHKIDKKNYSVIKSLLNPNRNAGFIITVTLDNNKV